ncbi:unnamed protein product [Arctia plantaginis]|uniref:Uncharacterized protein n=1 Tax=Arctia plantaginis TaxID=874455 RepID=A0A8S1B3Z4_ARCPL|nr:unnamed protein product [Arctia plantaginis]
MGFGGEAAEWRKCGYTHLECAREHRQRRVWLAAATCVAACEAAVEAPGEHPNAKGAGERTTATTRVVSGATCAAIASVRYTFAAARFVPAAHLAHNSGGYPLRYLGEGSHEG